MSGSSSTTRIACLRAIPSSSPGAAHVARTDPDKLLTRSGFRNGRLPKARLTVRRTNETLTAAPADLLPSSSFLLRGGCIAMPGLTCALLGEACRIFLSHAYPQGEETIPGPRRSYLRVHPGQPLDPLLKPPLCQALPTQNGGQGGWSFRLGSACYPNLKLQVVDCDGAGALVFCVDTHDGM